MEVAVRSQESTAVPFSGAAEVAGRSVDAAGSFAPGGSVFGGQRRAGARQRCGTRARRNRGAAERNVRLDTRGTDSGHAQRGLRPDIAHYGDGTAVKLRVNIQNKEYPGGHDGVIMRLEKFLAQTRRMRS